MWLPLSITKIWASEIYIGIAVLVLFLYDVINVVHACCDITVETFVSMKF